MDSFCRICNRELIDSKSIAIGVGPRCLKKLIKLLNLAKSDICSRCDLEKAIKEKYGLTENLFEKGKL